MANERDDQDRQQESGQQNQQSEFAQQGQQSQSERQQSGQEPFNSPEASNDENLDSSDGSGQPLSGTDSDTGTGTTLSEEFENSDTLTQSDSSQDPLNQNAGGGNDLSESDHEDSGFISTQGINSDDYLQERNPELAQEDALNQQNDDGMGSAASEQDS